MVDKGETHCQVIQEASASFNLASRNRDGNEEMKGNRRPLVSVDVRVKTCVVVIEIEAEGEAP